MWIDIAHDGSCHIGADAFVSRILGRIDRVRFLTGRGLQWPVASIEVRQTDLRLEFPRRIQITGSNVHLRLDPAALVDDPYGSGWLYSGVASPQDLNESAGEPELVRGNQVPAWMRREAERLDRFVRDHLTPDRTGLTAADGGSVVPGVAMHLNHEDLVDLFEAFFTLHGRRDP
jgi:glycine cleavage system H lipoate-binding protein